MIRGGSSRRAATSSTFLSSGTSSPQSWTESTIFDFRIPGWQRRIRLFQTRNGSKFRPGFGPSGPNPGLRAGCSHCWKLGTLPKAGFFPALSPFGLGLPGAPGLVSLCTLVYLVVYDTGKVSVEHLLLSRHPSQSPLPLSSSRVCTANPRCLLDDSPATLRQR